MSRRGYIQRLPNEILFQIMSLLEPSDAYQCISVCKSWYSSAVIKFYSNLVLDKSKLQFIYNHLPDLIDSNINKYGHLVKQLTLCDDKTSTAELNLVVKIILQNLPNLKTLDLSRSMQIKHHLKAFYNYECYLPGKIESFSLYNQYDPESKNVYYPGFKSNTQKYYIMACLDYQKTLKHLVLHDLEYGSQEFESSSPTSRLLYLLDFFENISQLTITKNQVLYDSSSNIDDVSELDSALKNCKYLETLEVINYYNGYRVWYEEETRHSAQFLRTVEQHVEEERFRQDGLISIAKDFKGVALLLVDMIQAHEEINEKGVNISYPTLSSPKLKNLTLVTPYLSRNQMEYIMNNIPLSQLEKFDLVVNRLCPYGWFRHVGSRNALIFAHYLSQVKNLRLYFKTNSVDYIANNYISILGYQPLQEVWTRIVFWSFVHAIRNSRDLQYSIVLHALNERIISQPDVKLTICEDKKVMSLTEIITMNSLLYEEFKFDSSNHDIPPPPPAFNYRVTNSTSELTLVIPPSDCIAELQIALKRFTKLHRLTIRSKNKILDIHPNMIDRRCIIECKSDKHPPYKSSLSSKAQLTKLKLQKASLTTRFIYAITSLLPNILELTLIDCDFFDEMNWISKKATLDLRRLSSLRSLDLIIQPRTSSYRKVIVCVREYLTTKTYPNSYYYTTYYTLSTFSQKKQHFRYNNDILNLETDALHIIIKVNYKLDRVRFYRSTYTPQDIILQ